MKKFLSMLSIIVLMVSCSTIKSENSNKNQKNVAKKEEAVQNAKNSISKNTEERLVQVSGLSYGVGYSLEQIPETNKVQEVTTAKELNSRILSIAGTPEVDEMVRIKKMVDLLNSEVDKEREKGEQKLSAKDAEITALQKEKVAKETVLQQKIDELTKTAKQQAEQNDNNKIIIDNVNKWFGLGAVYYGLKRFISSCLIAVLISGIVFLILKIWSKTNPVVASIFSIFEHVGSFAISCIRSIVPKSTTVNGLAPTTEVAKYKDTLAKLVDNIQEVIVMVKAGKPVTIDDMLLHFDKELDEPDKDVIREIKKELRWK